jgi:DNA-binding NarL/FixJ family response regulator
VKKVVLADSHEVFRTGIAGTISIRDEYRIVAVCSNSAKLLQAVSAFPRCIAIVATSLGTDLSLLHTRLQQTTSDAIAIVEPGTCAERFVGTFRGVVSREISPTALMDCVRHVARGDCWIAADLAGCMSSSEDPVGMRARDRLTTREMRVAALLLHGLRNREISIRLGTTEQVIKNCLRSIYEKSGASDRLELALFIHHHEKLAKAVATVAGEIHAEDLSAVYSIAVA